MDSITVNCDSCGDWFEASPIGGVGVSIGPPRDNPEYKKIVQRFGKGQFQLCWVCWLKAFGIKELDNGS